MPIERPKRVGLVVAAANPIVEPEMRRLLPPELALYATRLPVSADDQEASSDTVTAHYPLAVASFGALELDAIFIGVTDTPYKLSEARERALVNNLARESGAAIELASLAMLDTLRALGIDSIVLVAPYPDRLTDRAVAYWEEAQVRVRQVVKIAGDPKGQPIGTPNVAPALQNAHPPKGGAVIFAGTRIATLDTIATAVPKFDVPLLSATLCGAWRISMRLNARPGADLARCAPGLAARIPAPPLAGD